MSEGARSGIEIDPSFRGSGKVWQRRRRVRRIRQGVLAGVAVTGLVLILWLVWPDQGPEQQAQGDAPDSPASEEEALVQSSATALSAVDMMAASSEAFLDIRGAPMILNLPEGAGLNQQRLVTPLSLDPERAPAGTRLTVIDDALLDPSQRVQLTIPSSSADLAAFQARRQVAFRPMPEGEPVLARAGTEVEVADGEASWGDVIGGGGADADVTRLSYVETAIADTTTDVTVVPTAARSVLFRDALVRVRGPQTLKTLLEDQGLSTEAAARITATLEQSDGFGRTPATRLLSLTPGHLVALRLQGGPSPALLHMSVYWTGEQNAERLLISLGTRADGALMPAADPWRNSGLLDRTRQAMAARGGEVRLKDAIYSAALRNGMSSDVVGELMVILSRLADLDQIASDGDRLRVVLSDRQSGETAGRILYAEVASSALSLQCYVVRLQPRDPLACFDPKRGGAVARGGLGAGFLTPVAGTKTSGFGPRVHPILNKTLNHNGVDWKAPIGTPVHAAAGGEVSSVRVSTSFGNVVQLSHASGVMTLYAHLDGFAAGLAEGGAVRAGQLIGYVGTTGRSTGPHLHFELHVNGQPVDPLSIGGARGSAAVEALVNRIIKVESAGDARAKNTRSTATGLGQFIDATWLRMMRTYRPDLVANLSPAELLELRFDPALSRAMVTNLAEENAAFLRRRNHAISPGRLYLAHFLGPQGAAVALEADPAATVLEVHGAAVVRANPFLAAWSNAELIAWADRKMGGLGVGSAQAAVPAVVPAAVASYREALDRVLESL